MVMTPQLKRCQPHIKRMKLLGGEGRDASKHSTTSRITKSMNILGGKGHDAPNYCIASRIIKSTKILVPLES